MDRAFRPAVPEYTLLDIDHTGLAVAQAAAEVVHIPVAAVVHPAEVFPLHIHTAAAGAAWEADPMAAAAAGSVGEKSTAGAQVGSQVRSWSGCSSTATATAIATASESGSVKNIAADSRLS